MANVGFSLFLFTEELELASHLGNVCEALIELSPNRNTLRSRLCNELFGTLKSIKSPWHQVKDAFPELYSSAMLTGDVENALLCRWSYYGTKYWIGDDLTSLATPFLMCMKDAAKVR